jgi:type IV pilus assembly protein PilQ
MKKTIYCLVSLYLAVSLLFLPVSSYSQEEAVSPAVPAANQKIESLEFREVDIKDILRHLAKQYNLNIIFSEQVKGLVTVQLNSVTIDEALDSIITVNGFSYTRKENVIKVMTPEEAMREGMVTKVIPLNNADAVKLKDTLKKVLSANGSIEADVRSNALIVTDNPMVINAMNSMVPQLDQMTPQVLIEAKIIETTLSRSEKLGIDWTTTIKAAGSTMPTTFPFNLLSLKALKLNKSVYPSPFGTNLGAAGPTGSSSGSGNGTSTSTAQVGAFPAVIPSAPQFAFGTLDFSSLQAILDFLKTRSNTRLIASPRITTLNNDTATINVGQVLSIPNYSVDSTTGRMVINNWTPQNVGVTLQVTPQVSPDGHIRLKIKPEVSNLTGYAGTQDGVNVGPITSTRNADTEVQIRDGQTVVIAGLIKDKSFVKTSKIPVLGDIPLLGPALFTRRERSLDADPDEKTDLLIFVTASIIKDVDKPLLAYEHNVMTAPPRQLKMEIKQDILDPRFKLLEPKSK